jgi:HEPN domain-containing protein
LEEKGLSSGVYFEKLWKRARAMLEGAEWRLHRGEYDLACFEAEQAAQLGIKAVLYKFLGSAPRVHEISELLGVLYKLVESADKREAAQRLAEFVQSRRRQLWLLSDSYYRARYGYIDYDEDDAKNCVKAARELLKLLAEIGETLGED